MANLKKISMLILIALALAALAGAFDILMIIPADGHISLNANLSSGSTSSDFICTATGSATANVSNVTRWDNSTGTWQRNQSNLTFLATGGAVQNVTFVSPKNYSDAFSFIWACEVCVNGTSVAGSDFCQNSTWTKFSENRTLRYEFPPNVTLEIPATGNVSKESSVPVRFTANSDYLGSGVNRNILDCRVWDNSSGTWTRSPLSSSAGNNTTTSFPHQFSENQTVSWNVECAERNEPSVKAFAPSNFTITVDTTNPAAVLNAPSNNALSTSRTVLLNWTATDNNLGGCSLFHNASGSWANNQTNYTNVSGSPQIANLTFSIDGEVAWGVQCNDTAKRSVSTSNFTFVIDTADSTMVNVTNYTVPDTCTKVGIAWNTSEFRNGSISYGTTIDLGTNVTVHTDATTTHQANLTFGTRVETLFYYNVTSCDAAGNCNRSANSVNTPVGLCNEGGNNAGWSAFAVLQNGETLGTLANRSGATLAYWWNGTGQSWTFNQKATTANANVPVNYGEAVLLYSATNQTWFRNTTVTGNYQINLTVGDNFFGLSTDYTFWNLTQTFKNSSLGESIPEHGNFNFTNNSVFFSSWNNSAHAYLNHYRGFLFENITNLSRGNVAWAWVERYNVTWNGTAIQTNLSNIS